MSGGIVESGLTAPVDATDIGNGDVDNTELSFINSLTENVQDALDAAISLADPNSWTALQTFANGIVNTDELQFMYKYFDDPNVVMLARYWVNFFGLNTLPNVLNFTDLVGTSVIGGIGKNGLTIGNSTNNDHGMVGFRNVLSIDQNDVHFFALWAMRGGALEEAYCGMADEIAATPSDLCYHVQDWANGGDLQELVTFGTGSETATDTDEIIVEVTQAVEIIITDSLASLEIDGVIEASHATNLPSNDMQMCFGLINQNSTNRAISVAWMEFLNNA